MNFDIVASMIFLLLATWGFVATLYAIDLQTDKENLEEKLKVTIQFAAFWKARATFTVYDLGDEDRDRPLDCYQLHAELYGEKENA